MSTVLRGLDIVVDDELPGVTFDTEASLDEKESLDDVEASLAEEESLDKDDVCALVLGGLRGVRNSGEGALGLVIPLPRSSLSLALESDLFLFPFFVEASLLEEPM